MLEKSPRKILVVDDDPHILKLFGKYLSRSGYAVETADTGEKALALLKSHEISLVLLDIIMPDMDGLEILRSIKEIYPSLPVIALTGLKDVEKAKLIMKSGVVDYVTKPVDFEYLDSTILANLP